MRSYKKEQGPTVQKYDDQADYGADVEETFQKFKQRDVKNYRLRFIDHEEMDHVEEGILELVARLYPEIFRSLHDFNQDHRDYLDPTILRFDREVQFFIAYLELIEPLRSSGLGFCYPIVSRSKEVRALGTFRSCTGRQARP